MTKNAKQYLKGAVSIYVVIFTALVISIITVSFIRIMVSNERQSSNADLSQSARDSALSGVEDAKIALLKYVKQCPNGKNSDAGTTDAQCQNIYKKITGECNEFHSYVDGGGVDSKNSEIPVQRNDSSANQNNDKVLQQAYTCVKIQVETDDYLGAASAGKSELIPLVPELDPNTGAQKTIDNIELSWYTIGDNSGKTDVLTPKNFGSGSNCESTSSIINCLLDQSNSDWGPQAPSLMRVQLIQTDPTFTLQQLDAQGSGTASDRGTIFLYPKPTYTASQNASSSFGITPAYALGSSSAYNSVERPIEANCYKNFKVADGYACKAKISLPRTISNSMNRKNTFIKLTGYYHDQTSYKMVMMSGDSVVKFDGVQPAVDATGRASDLYRRVESRIQLFGDAIFPEFAVDMNKDSGGSGQFCKLLTISDESNNTRAGNTSYTCLQED
ncbi:MAG: hypothetical protein LBL84_01800 [Candidatus Nomurabacteria bacterium]|jgi:Tfp pilus assembly protein PilX|nr:hypothetical protein [Candidatus Nomurabacteria bacterium]